MKPAELFFDLRDDLAFRKLRGERLTLRDEFTLSILNEAVQNFLPPPSSLPEDVRAAMHEVRRLRQRS
jgi:hypothetical protein